MFNMFGNKDEPVVDDTKRDDTKPEPVSVDVNDIEKLDLQGLFKEEPVKDDEQPELPQFSPGIDKDVLAELSKRYDFGKMIPKDIAQELGDMAGPMAKLMDVMGKSVYASAIRDIATLNDGLVKQYDEYSQKRISPKIKDAIDQDKFSSDPMLSNNLVRKMLEPVMAEVKSKYPQLTVAQQQQLAKRVIKESVGIVDPPKQEEKPKVSNTGWAEFAGLKTR